MAKTTTIEGLADAIAQELSLYNRDVQDKVDKAGRKAIRELVRITKDTAPFNARAYHRHYTDLIASKSETGRAGLSRHIWYVKPPAHRLTHLLVHGHATKDGGRTKADPFLQKALDRVLPEYEKAVEEAVKGD